MTDILVTGFLVVGWTAVVIAAGFIVWKFTSTMLQ